ncbi:MAG TPA: SIMPL domain-containing protein [Mobilitalea sp.]|nr:SIMPL domain-containing protein [Mobilitalea sp.]
MPNSLCEFSDKSCITLTGSGQVNVQPDIAVLRLGVVTTGENLSGVQADNAELSQAVLQLLKEMGITDIKTIRYTIDKLYDFENGTRIDRGYSVSNVFEIRTGEMNMVGAILDIAVQNGVNLVEFISFEISDPDYYYQQALNLAISNAIDKAKSITRTLGILIDPQPLCITEQSPTAVPFQRFSSVGESFAVTPIEPGTNLIEAFVTAEFNNEQVHRSYNYRN